MIKPVIFTAILTTSPCVGQGFVIIYSALVAKLRRINEIMVMAQSFRRVEVPKRKVLLTMVLLLAIQVGILVAWQLVSPLKWQREVTESDPLTGYPTESIGRCTSDHFAAFAGACALFIGFCLAYALRIAYKTRRMPIEFSESKYIALSVAYLLQLLVLGVPILVIATENRNAFFMVLSLILFLTSFGISLLIFVPKIMAHRDRVRRNVENLVTRAARTTRITRTSDNGEDQGTVAQIRNRVTLRASENGETQSTVEEIRKRIRASDDGEKKDDTDALPHKGNGRSVAFKTSDNSNSENQIERSQGRDSMLASETDEAPEPSRNDKASGVGENEEVAADTRSSDRTEHSVSIRSDASDVGFVW